jgi:DNA-binding response OmpR family regulator
MSGERILVVDDEPSILDLVGLYLGREGYRVETAADGATALQRIQARPPALLVLDLMLPEVDGYEVCRRVRATSNLPILMLTARDDDVDKIVGLELGADDYLTKPFNPRELVARVKAILRRVDRPPAGAPDPIHLADVTLDPGRREVTVAGAPISLRPKEFDLLQTLVEHRGLVLTREQLLRQAWGFDFYGETRTVDVHIGHLRKHLAPSQSVRIETVTGVGYKLVL